MLKGESVQNIIDELKISKIHSFGFTTNTITTSHDEATGVRKIEKNRKLINIHIDCEVEG